MKLASIVVGMWLPEIMAAVSSVGRQGAAPAKPLHVTLDHVVTRG